MFTRHWSQFVYITKALSQSRSYSSPVEIKMYAANGAITPVLGQTAIQFNVDEILLKANFLVSDIVEEPVLGLDLLTGNVCEWKFDRKEINNNRQ
jgi:hypothetical protein